MAPKVLLGLALCMLYHASGLQHIGSEQDYDRAGNLNLKVHSNARNGDLMVLSLMRTDDVLPIKLSGWTAAASCYKTNNGQSSCATIKDCTSFYDQYYCRTFGSKGNGRDLATIMLYRTVGNTRSYTFNLRNSHAGWGILSVFRGAKNNDPIGQTAGASNDRSKYSRYPSVSGSRGDMLLLSMSFDDTAKESQFLPPSGMTQLEYSVGNDEAGFLYGTLLTKDGATGEKITRGTGGPNAKDCLISLILKSSSGNVAFTPTPEPAAGQMVKVSSSAGTCNNYCREQGKSCVGAQEDNRNNQCDPPLAVERCSTNFKTQYPGTSDMCCACARTGSLAVNNMTGCVDNENQLVDKTLTSKTEFADIKAAAKAAGYPLYAVGGTNDTIYQAYFLKSVTSYSATTCEKFGNIPASLEKNAPGSNSWAVYPTEATSTVGSACTSSSDCAEGQFCPIGGATPKVCASDNGYCTNEKPCMEGDGDCDSDTHCEGDLKCGSNNCASSTNLGLVADCCFKSLDATTCKANCAEPKFCPVGGPSAGSCIAYDPEYCTAEKPCSEGEGDCDSHDQCAGDLKCGTDNCGKPEWADTADCCTSAPVTSEPPADVASPPIDSPDTPDYGLNNPVDDDDDDDDDDGNTKDDVSPAYLVAVSLAGSALPFLLSFVQ